MSSSAQSSSFTTSLEAYWRDDYLPLEDAGKLVLAALRNDEAAPDADLFRRISASGSESHRYFSSTAPVSSSAGSAGLSNGTSNDVYTPGRTATASTPPAGLTSPGFATMTSPGLLSPGHSTSLIATSNTPASNGINTPATIPSEPPPAVTLKHVKSVPLPEVMANEVKSITGYSLMGLLPEAELAWMSVDSKLFVWPYTSPSTPVGRYSCSFTIPSGQAVLSVGLVQPKKGVFKKFVKWCLVVTTPDEVILCALVNAGDNFKSEEDCDDDHTERKNNNSTGRLQLIPTHFTVPTDFVRMLCICGTEDGRIFLGGEDGCLYEMAYERIDGGTYYNGTTVYSSSYHPPLSLDEQLELFYDGGKTIPAVIADESQDSSVAGWVVRNGKRVISSVAGFNNSRQLRPRKCRKMNHSSQAPTLARAIVPDFLLKAGSFLVGGGRATGGGKIVQIVADEERRCLYTLTSRGWICTYYLTPPSAVITNSGGQNNNQVRLAAVIDAAKTAQLYLEAVSRGQVNSPSSYSSTTGNVSFAGGSSSAQLGVGGMDGARNILKQAEFSMKPGTSGRNSNSSSESSLTPVSLHVVPRKESSCLTLVAITKTGNRYYISSLPKVAFSGAKHVPYAPDRKITLFHVRAPPPITNQGQLQDTSALDSDISVGGFAPRVAGSSSRSIPQVDAGYYQQGTMVLALEHHDSSASSSADQPVGDLVVAVAPDAVARVERKTTPNGPSMPAAGINGGRSENKAPGGVSETISIPMLTAYGFYAGSASDIVPILPGGKVWGIGSTSPMASPVLNLALNSQTPTDNELSVGLVPEFVPSSRISRVNGGSVIVRSRLPGYRSPGNSTPVEARGSLTSTALTVAWNLLWSRPILHGIKIQEPFLDVAPHRRPVVTANYRISKRYGTRGFSLTAAEPSASIKREGTVTIRSARLSPWLLRPSTVALNLFTIQHLLPPRQIVMLNAVGLQYFEIPTLLTQLEEALMRAGVNADKDNRVTNFFTSYGYAEGCAMCLFIAIGCGSANMPGELKDRAKSAAMARAFTPKLVRVAVDAQHGAGFVQNAASDGDILIPAGYNFQSSAILAGVTSVMSRLLRPIWFKPAVVVTEGRMVQLLWRSNKRSTPAKVELLLDTETLDQVLQPLHSLTEVIKDLFAVAVLTVPGVNRKPSDAMDIDGDNGQGHFFTNSMLHQRHVHDGTGDATAGLSSDEENMIARLTEERKFHSLYRLLSRSVQLLRLLFLLREAHFAHGLPEVEWGSLHGLTIAQLVQSRESQARLEKLLNRLVTSAADMESLASTEADDLARQLADKCYLFFSLGAYYAYLGFRDAKGAKECPPQSTEQQRLALRAADYFRKAAHHWNSASLITGRSLQTNPQDGYDNLAITAYGCGSPLAMAVSDLVVLGDVDSAVDICLIAASNFRGQSMSWVPRTNLAQSENGLPWEQGLYHKGQEPVRERQAAHVNTNGGSMSASPSNALSLGTAVTLSDAVDTCYALIFYSISELLRSEETRLAERMVARCAEETNNVEFLCAFFRHMDTSGHRDILLRIDSGPQLENWLIRHDDPNLLYGYYVQQGRHFDAGRISLDRATSDTLNLSLAERIECLSRAAGSFSTALRDTPRAVAFETLEVIRGSERNARAALDMAKLQGLVLHAAEAGLSKINICEENYQRLAYGLLDISVLFNDYAEPMGLYDVMLRIVHCSEQRDQVAYIERLWRYIVCAELTPCATRSEKAFRFLQDLTADYSTDQVVVFLTGDAPDDGSKLFESGQTLKLLENKVIGLGRELYGGGADFIFPVDAIIDLLEPIRRTHQEASGLLTSSVWTLNILIEVGVPYMFVLTAYESSAHREIQTEFAETTGQGRRRECLENSLSLVLKWVSTPRQYGHDDELSQEVNNGRLRRMINEWRAELERLQQNDDMKHVLEVIERKISVMY